MCKQLKKIYYIRQKLCVRECKNCQSKLLLVWVLFMNICQMMMIKQNYLTQ